MREMLVFTIRKKRFRFYSKVLLNVPIKNHVNSRNGRDVNVLASNKFFPHHS